MGKGGKIVAPFVWDKSHIERIYIEPLRHENGIALHKAVNNRGYTVSHLTTGSAIWSKQSWDTAVAFFEQVWDWPEWMQGRTISDFQFLRDRVFAARRLAGMS